MESRKETDYLERALAQKAAPPLQVRTQPAAIPFQVAKPLQVTLRKLPLVTVGGKLDPFNPTDGERSHPELVAEVPAEGATILDVGCATGAMGRALLYKGAREVVGFDSSAEAVSVARSRLTAAYRYDVNELPELPYPKHYFDVITVAEALSQLTDPEESLKHLIPWLKPGGKLVCAVPNVRHESVVLSLLVDGTWNYAATGILASSHVRFFTLSSIQQLIASVGLELNPNAQIVQSRPSSYLERTVEFVRTLGGNPDQFRLEASIVKYLITATAPAQPGMTTSKPVLDPWRGSRPHRLLLAPQIDDPKDCWQQLLLRLAEPSALEETVTVGIAIPMDLLKEAPPAVLEVVTKDTLDLLFIEAPTDPTGWERLLGGAHTLLATSAMSSLRNVAERIGVDVVDAASLAP
jgi:2-polyprenyl-3-methyl-5-hydroxy-6-metoxy-1,4-benzoquinol methylase